jgi:hypothetical protein
VITLGNRGRMLNPLDFLHFPSPLKYVLLNLLNIGESNAVFRGFLKDNKEKSFSRKLYILNGDSKCNLTMILMFF